MHFAARESHLEILKELLVAGATKEVQDNEGQGLRGARVGKYRR